MTDCGEEIQDEDGRHGDLVGFVAESIYGVGIQKDSKVTEVRSKATRSLTNNIITGVELFQPKLNISINCSHFLIGKMSRARPHRWHIADVENRPSVEHEVEKVDQRPKSPVDRWKVVIKRLERLQLGDDTV